MNLNEKGRQFPKGLRVMKEPMGGTTNQSHIHIEEDFSRVHLFGGQEPVQLKAVEVRAVGYSVSGLVDNVYHEWGIHWKVLGFPLPMVCRCGGVAVQRQCPCSRGGRPGRRRKQSEGRRSARRPWRSGPTTRTGASWNGPGSPSPIPKSSSSSDRCHLSAEMATGMPTVDTAWLR